MSGSDETPDENVASDDMGLVAAAAALGLKTGELQTLARLGLLPPPDRRRYSSGLALSAYSAGQLATAQREMAAREAEIVQTLGYDPVKKSERQNARLSRRRKLPFVKRTIPRIEPDPDTRIYRPLPASE